MKKILSHISGFTVGTLVFLLAIVVSYAATTLVANYTADQDPADPAVIADFSNDAPLLYQIAGQDFDEETDSLKAISQKFKEIRAVLED